MLGRFNPPVNGLVLLGKSSPETSDFPISWSFPVTISQQNQSIGPVC